MGIHPEALLISAVIRQQDHLTPAKLGISPQMFHAYRTEWTWIDRYISLHRKTPSRMAFKSKFLQFQLYVVDDVEHFTNEVRLAHREHQLKLYIARSLDALEDGKVEESCQTMADGLRNLEAELLVGAGIENIVTDHRAVLHEVQRRIDTRAKLGSSGIPTGFKTLDDHTGGIQPGEYWVLLGRLGQGKTWIALKTAFTALDQGMVINYHALEQSRQALEMRMHAFISSKYWKTTFRHSDMVRGVGISTKEFLKYLESLPSKLNGSRALHFLDTARGRVSAQSVAAMIEAKKPNLVIIDYLTLMERSTQDWQGVEELSGSIKQLATQYQVPILVLAQANRMGEGREPPGTETIANSDAIGRDADAVVSLKQATKRVVRLYMAKYRNGVGGFHWWARFEPNIGRIEEIEADDARVLMDEDRMEGDE